MEGRGDMLLRRGERALERLRKARAAGRSPGVVGELVSLVVLFHPTCELPGLASLSKCYMGKKGVT